MNEEQRGWQTEARKFVKTRSARYRWSATDEGAFERGIGTSWRRARSSVRTLAVPKEWGGPGADS